MARRLHVTREAEILGRKLPAPLVRIIVSGGTNPPGRFIVLKRLRGGIALGMILQGLLHAFLFGQRTIPATLENRLIRGLRSLLLMDAYADDALRALVCMNSHHSHEIAWDFCVAQFHLGASRASLGSRLYPDDLRPLYTPERLEWLRQQLQTESLSPLADLLLAAWADFISPERAEARTGGL